MQLPTPNPKEHIEVAGLPRRLLLNFTDINNIIQLHLRRFGIFTLLASQPPENKRRLLFPPDFHEPSRTLWHEPDDNRQRDQRHDLERHRKPPDEGALLVGEPGSPVFDPVSHNHAEDIERELQTDELSTTRVRGSLGCPHGRNSVQDASADAVEDSSAEHPVCVLRRALEHGADDAPEAGETDGRDAAVFVADPAAEKTADERAGKVVHCDDATLEKGLVRDDDAGLRIVVAETHEFGVVAGGVDAAHEACE